MKGLGSMERRVLFGARRQMCGCVNSFSSDRTGAHAGRGRAGARLRASAARLLREESGQTLIMTALCLTLLMAGMAMAVDVGYLHYQQRQLQTAADSAAIAAGLELTTCSNAICPAMTTAASQALIEDGIASSSTTPTSNACAVPSTSSGLAMGINVHPCLLGSSDPNYTNSNMAEVVLAKPQSTFFLRLFGFSSMNLVARAEAGDAYIQNPPSGNYCIWTKSITFNANDGDFNLSSCGIYDGGPANQSDLTTDNGVSVTATSFQYYGTWGTNNCNGSCVWNLGGTNTGPPSHTTTPQTDPLAGLTQPTQPATQQSGNLSINASTKGSPATTLQPGYYGGGININAPGSGQTNVVNLSPGLYYFNGSVNVNSGATLECTTCTGTGSSGVTLYFANGSFQPNSSANVTLNAPSAALSNCASCANMLVWESSSNGSGMDMDASTSVTLNGIIYLPDAQLTLNSGSGTTINAGATATAVNVQSLMVDSGITFDLKGSLLSGAGTPSSTLSTTFALAE